MSSRERMLKELNLHPLWVRRERAAAPPASEEEGVLAEPAMGSHNSVALMDWTALKDAVRSCTLCPLHAGRKQSVFGAGDESASWLFIGEGPGAEEDAKGEPFVGQAGRLLDNMLAAIGLKRGEDVYIANIVKCRPPGNRVPEP
ncbi:MAG: uracil-DNA glycosylase family protein, partial [Burkholderiales bacterium]